MELTPNPKCPRCKCYWKPDETDIKSSGLYFFTCKKCRDNNKKYYQENQDKYKEYYQENQDKIKEYKKQYNQENQDKIKEKQKQYKKQYNQENKDKIKEQKKQFYQENKDKINNNQKKYIQNIKQNNIPLYLCILQRTQLSRVIKQSNHTKIKHSIEYLGCDSEYLKSFLQSKMDLYNQIETNEIKMDFTNIHIDHIKPISKFNLDDEDEFLDCCHYTNLQPLLIQDNLSKHNKWTDEAEIFWNENIKGKEYLSIYMLV